MMRVITGTARGRRLETLSGEDVTRPTTESVKEALFSMIQFEIEGRKVLDLFAGSGQLGIEALSRGASHCTFVENNRQAVAVVKNNIARCKLESKSYVFTGDAMSLLMRSDCYDIAFLDPPYDSGIIQQCLVKLLPMMSQDGIVVCETSAAQQLEDSVCGWYADRVRKYGKTKLTLYRKEL